MAHAPSLPLLLLVALVIPYVWTATVNRTIDDFYGDPVAQTYATFGDGWSFCANCVNRALSPSGAFDHTYAVSGGTNVTLQFVGNKL